MRRLCLSLLAGVLMASAGQAQDRPQVIAVHQALQAMAQQLLGDAGEVMMPVPAGVDPSFWRPSIADISRVQGAELILLNGAGFAAWVDRVSLPRSRVVNTTRGLEARFIVTESITHSHGDGGSHSHEGLAAYTWLDPELAIAQADRIAAALVARGLAPKAEVQARLATLSADLTALDAQAQAALEGAAELPMIATHPRYQYFARRYGLSLQALEWEAGALPSAAERAALEGLVAETGARILIWEAQPPAEALEMAETMGLQNVIFAPGAAPGAAFPQNMRDAVADLAKAVAAVSN